MIKEISKYDWESLKLEFMHSDFKQVKSFFQSRLGTYTGQIHTRTTGWTRQKKQLARDANERALIHLLQEKSLDLAEAKEAIIQELYRRTSNEKYMREISCSEIKTIWVICRIELGQPLRYKDACSNCIKSKTKALTPEEEERRAAQELKEAIYGKA